MAENTPASTGGGGADRGSGGRRSGLDRLRAARGDAAPAEATPAEDVEARSAGSTTTVLDTDTPDLDQPETEDGPAPSASADDATDAADAPRGKRRGRRRRTAAAADPGASGDADASGGSPRRRRGRVPSRGRKVAPATSSRTQVLIAVGLAILVVALAVPVISMRERILGETSGERAVKSLVAKREAGLVAGRQFAVTFFTFDYRKVDDFIRDVQAQTVGDFNRDFADRAGQLKSTLVQVQSVATASVLTAGVSRVSGNDVEVLLIVDQNIQNKNSQGKTVAQRYRVAVNMQQTPAGWRASGVTQVP
jgi:hypothetical protein